MSKTEQVTARLPRDLLEVVESVAATERRPVSSVVRNVLEDWARARESQAATREQADMVHRREMVSVHRTCR